MKFCLAVAILASGVLLVSCGDGSNGEETESSGPVIYTTFYPTTYFTQRLVGDLAEVVCPVPVDEDAIFWNPTPEMIARYQAADLIIVNGAEFEKWVAKASLPLGRIVDTAKPFAAEFVKFEHAMTHSHGPAGEHAHTGTDGHTWLDPLNARVQVGEIRDALVGLLPEHAEAIRQRGDALLADLDALDAELKKMAADYDGAAIYASHPAYNYLARRYGLNVVNLDLDPGEMPARPRSTSCGRPLRCRKSRLA
jgi:zinc transport system substrate-binding protein